MLFNPNKELALVIYNENAQARCYKFTRSHIKVILISISFILCISVLSSVFFYIYGKQKEKGSEVKLSLITQDLKQKITTLNASNIELNGLNNELTKKLTVDPKDKKANKNLKSSSHPLFMLFESIKGFQDFSHKKMITLEDHNIKVEKNKITFSFNIIKALSGNEKINGHILILFKERNKLHVFPSNMIFSQSLTIKFYQGEPFSVRRLRPVNATFSLDANEQLPPELFFKIFIFSRTGNLIHKDEYMYSL